MPSKTQDQWDNYFLQLAEQAAKLGTCDRKKVGCVIVSPTNRVVSTGYNGSIPGTPHCDDEGHLIHNGTCIRTIHAEQNALINVQIPQGSTCYCTLEPCTTCFKLLMSAGVTRIVYIDAYREGFTQFSALTGTYFTFNTHTYKDRLYTDVVLGQRNNQRHS